MWWMAATMAAPFVLDVEGARVLPGEPAPLMRDAVQHGTIVARYGPRAWTLAKRERALVVYLRDRRVARYRLPADWDFASTRFTQVGERVLAVDDERALLFDREAPEGRLILGRRPLQVDASGRYVWETGTGIAMDLKGEEPGFRTAPPILELGEPVRHGDLWAASHDRRAIVWNQEGEVLLVTGEPDRGKHHLTPDGRWLVTVDTHDQAVFSSIGTDLTWKESVCRGASEVWAVSPSVFLVQCPDRLTLHREGAQVDLDLRGIPVRRLVAVDDGALEVHAWHGYGAVQAWSIRADGSTQRAHRATGPVGEGWDAGTRVDIPLTMVDGLPVEVSTAVGLERMRDAARADGVELNLNSGFRTWEEQARLRRCYETGACNNGNLAARPGHSRHQSGVAVDLDVRDRGVLGWLREHASEHGFYETVRGEPWHWEYGGGRALTALHVSHLAPAELSVVRPALPAVVYVGGEHLANRALGGS